MTRHTVVLRRCSHDADPAAMAETVDEMLGRLPAIEKRLAAARRIFIKINLSPGAPRTYQGRTVDYVDPVVFRALGAFIKARSPAEVLVGDGPDGVGLERAAKGAGPPGRHRRARSPAGQPQRAALRALSRASPRDVPLVRPRIPPRGIDLVVSLAKMKAHHLCGVTLSIKNLFGLPPNTVYGSPRGALHSAVRIAGVLADLAQLFPPALCLADGIVGANYSEWGGDPVASGVLVAGDNAVATDAVAARYMGVYPAATRGTPPFLIADNHIRRCAEHGLGSIDGADTELLWELPAGRRPFTASGSSEPTYIADMETRRRGVCELARGYFDDRERFVRDYAGEIIGLYRGTVFHHQRASADFFANFYQAMTKEGISFYDPFLKLVEAEEAELQVPYAAVQ